MLLHPVCIPCNHTLSGPCVRGRTHAVLRCCPFVLGIHEMSDVVHTGSSEHVGRRRLYEFVATIVVLYREG